MNRQEKPGNGSVGKIRGAQGTESAVMSIMLRGYRTYIPARLGEALRAKSVNYKYCRE